jgi:integral membrane sensor domain MASE1
LSRRGLAWVTRRGETLPGVFGVNEHSAVPSSRGDGTDLRSQATKLLEADLGDARADPTWRWPTERPGGLAVLFVMSAGFYALGLQLALELIDASGLSSVFFIPAGITVGFLLRLPRHAWWVVLVAVGLVEAAMDLAAGYSVPATAGFVAANVAEPLVAALLVARLVGPVDLARIRHVLAYLFSAVLVAPGIGALIGSTPAAAVSGEGFFPQFWQWWLGDALGVLLVGTAILAWGSSQDRRPLRSALGAIQLLGSLLLTIGVLAAGLPMMFLVLIGVVVAGAVFGIRAVAATALVVAITVSFGLAFGVGLPGDAIGEATALVLVKLQLGLFTIAGIVVAAEAYEGARAKASAARAASWAEAADRERVMERQTALQLQQALLPPPPVADPRFEVAARYVPGGPSLLVGGDWHNLFRLPDGRFGLMVGDVVGHGLEASAAMGRLSTAAVVLARMCEGPGAMLSNLNRYVSEVGPVDFATAVYAVLDAGTGAIRYASAGHPPMLMVEASGVARWLDDGLSPPLYGSGVAERGEASMTLRPGDMLVAYSDGLIERRGEDIARGLDRLEALVRRMFESPPAAVCDALLGELGASREDDAVVLVLRYTGRTTQEPG